MMEQQSPPAAQAEAPRPNKGDIVNRLIRQHGLKRYLEYNKFDGATYYDDIECAHKEAAYLPERSYLDGHNLRRLLDVAKDAKIDDILSPDQLLKRYENKQFDIIFFDPVHVRPDVDHALRALPRLLRRGGFLVVHDCNPRRLSQTTLQRIPETSWVGETYKAFSVLRAHNREQTVTVDEDFGVGLIWNIDLNLDYDIDYDIDYFEFAGRRDEYIGLIDYAEFLARTEQGKPERLFTQPPQKQRIQLLPRQISAALDRAPQQPAGPPRGSAAPQARWANSQVFWRAPGADYTERYSREMPICYDGSSQLLAILLVDMKPPVGGLRFDFSDSPGLAWLESMVLKNPQRETLWSWDGQESGLRRQRNLRCLPIGAAAGGQALLLATSNDPSFDLDLPPGVLEALGPGALLEVRLTPLPHFLQPIFNELHAARSELRLRQAAFDALDARVAVLEASLSALRALAISDERGDAASPSISNRQVTDQPAPESSSTETVGTGSPGIDSPETDSPKPEGPKTQAAKN